MIDLKNLTREERTLITIQCDSFFIDYEDKPQFKPVYTHMVKEFKRTYSKELWTIITACTKALKLGIKGSQLSLNERDYTTANKTHQKKISYTRMLRLIPLLVDAGYIQMYRGYQDPLGNTSLKSCFLMTDKMISLFDSVNIQRFTKVQNPKDIIEIRDSETKCVISDLSKIRGVGKEKNLIVDYNKLLQGHDIRVKGRKASVRYKRVYSGDLDGAGRWYTYNGFQTASKRLRPLITIDGSKTTEVDYKQIHARILYSLDREEVDDAFEPYHVPASIIPAEISLDRRNLCKFSIMCLLNSSSKNSAVKAIRDRLRKDRKRPQEEQAFKTVEELSSDQIKNIITALEEHNHRIKHWFYTDMLWAKLQNYDSTMAAFIIQEFMDRGKVILGWHDSFVVCAEDRQLLVDTMRKAWYGVLNTEYNFAVEVEW